MSLYDQKITGLHSLVNEYWKDYEDYVQNFNWKFIVKPSIPIVWFGDLKAYFNNSDWKVVTLAINPSSREFPKKRFSRFPEIHEIESPQQDIDNVIMSYNNYFKNDPYTFFSAFDRALQNLPNEVVASYGDSDNPPRWFENSVQKYRTPVCTAVHIDFETALATSKSWKSGKKNFEDEISFQEFQDTKKTLSKSGRTLFKKLLAFLDPHIILFSNAVLFL